VVAVCLEEVLECLAAVAEQECLVAVAVAEDNRNLKVEINQPKAQPNEKKNIVTRSWIII
jgi:hypothetical protein